MTKQWRESHRSHSFHTVYCCFEKMLGPPHVLQLAYIMRDEIDFSIFL